MNIIIKNFDSLSKKELYDILSLRNGVFVVEQECAYQDADGKDESAFHLLGTVKTKLVAYLRIFRAGDYAKNASIGRVLVKQEYRKQQYGKTIMKKALSFLVEELKEMKIELSAQTYLLDFYKDLGFMTEGEEYLEDNIPHIRMIATPGNNKAC
jgi:ElaA protein